MDAKQLIAKMVEYHFTEREFRHTLALVQIFLEARLYGGETRPLEEHITYFFETRLQDVHVGNMFRSWGEDFFSTFNTKNVYELLGALEGELDDLPSITLFVPTELPRESIVAIGTWLRAHVHPQLMMALSIEPDLAAGCAIERDGIYHDFSFRYFVQKHKRELLHTIHEHTYAA